MDSGWLGSHQRLTVSSLTAAMASVEQGLGFGWLPAHSIADKLEDGDLVPVDLTKGKSRVVRLQLGMSPDQAHVGEVNTLFELFSNLKTMIESPPSPALV